MAVIVVGVDCVAAGTGKCYTRELIEIAEEYVVPLTWFLTVSPREPMGTTSLYYNEFLHRIPAWHELSVRLDLSNGGNIGDPQQRRDAVRLGKEMLKQCHVKPVSCRLAGSALLSSDITNLEDAGFVVAVANVPARAHAPLQPYHPAYEDPSANGDAKLLVVNQPGLDLSRPWEEVRAGLDEARLARGVLLLVTRDDRDIIADLRRALEHIAPARPQTLTAAATA